MLFFPMPESVLIAKQWAIIYDAIDMWSKWIGMLTKKSPIFSNCCEAGEEDA
jgi:hypothetical protein